MKLKEGVSLQNAKLEIRPILIYAETLWKKYGEELVITSYMDGVHSAGSLHYYGYAVDLRSRYFDTKTITNIKTALSKALGQDYRVIIEPTHIHVEYRRILKPIFYYS